VNPHSRALASASGRPVYEAIEQLPDSEFDVVISNHVLEHIRDVPTTLERLRAKLRPGGRLLLKLPLDDWRSRNQRLPSSTDIDHHLHTWTPLLLGNTLKESGFVVDECRVITSAWHPRLFPLARIGLGKAAFWAFAAVMKRRQVFAVAHVGSRAP
jgi:SAM-dependent methyltransferase